MKIKEVEVVRMNELLAHTHNETTLSDFKYFRCRFSG